MHELGVVFHIMDSLEKVAVENEVTGISRVVLELGEVSTVIESYLHNCWQWAAKKRSLWWRRSLRALTVKAAVRPMPPWSTGRYVPAVTARIRGFCRGMSLISKR